MNDFTTSTRSIARNERLYNIHTRGIARNERRYDIHRNDLARIIELLTEQD